VSVAHASDGGGSIRIPASSCGLVGLKPTRGRSSFGPGVGERWAGCSSEHVVARTVRDVAALLDVVSGPGPGDPYFAPPPTAPFAARLAPGPRLRIGSMADVAPRQSPVHPECRAAAERAARALADLGHHVEPSYPAALDETRAIGAFVEIVAANVAFALDRAAAKVGKPLTEDDCEPLTWAVASAGRQRSATDYIATLDAVHAFSRRVAAWWSDGWDLLLTPTLPTTAFAAGGPPPDGVDGSAFASPMHFVAFTYPFNFTGHPAASVRAGYADDGLPVGLQIVAPRHRDDLVLQASFAFEEARPWNDRWPALGE